MGATSVSGRGPGSSEKNSKGSKDRGTIGVEHLVGPYVVKAGSVTLASGTAAVVFPLSGVSADYIALATNQEDTSTPANGQAKVVISSGVATLTINSAGTTDTFAYAVIKISGLGL